MVSNPANVTVEGKDRREEKREARSETSRGLETTHQGCARADDDMCCRIMITTSKCKASRRRTGERHADGDEDAEMRVWEVVK